MAEATTGNNLTGMNQGTGIVGRISSSISNAEFKQLINSSWL